MFRRVATALACWLAVAVVATAQTPPPSERAPQPTPSTTTVASVETRPATTTFFGDTGLWFVPTGEILPDRKFSASAYRGNWDREPGFTDYSLWPITFGVGLRDRVELFGSFQVLSRIDRDVRPIFNRTIATEGGGVLNELPTVREGWTGNHVGDFYVGAKFNITSEHRQQAAASAVRAMVKLPTGDDERGATGKPDFLIDAIVSKEVAERVEVAGYGGFTFRSDPDDFNLSHGFRWGFGAGFPSRKPFRVFTELNGEIPFDDEVDVNGTLTATDFSVAPNRTVFDAPIDLTLGLTWQARNGFFAGVGWNWNMALDGRSEFGSQFSDETGDAWGWQFRVGYHPGVRVYVAPPPPPPPPPPAAPPVNRPPTVKARCEPCTVVACSGQTSTVTGDASDPDGDVLTYRWSAPTGKLAPIDQPKSIWTPPCEVGPVPVTITVDDRKGGTASDTVTIQVIKPAVKEIVFEDVHFDFDRYTLRPEATRVLDEAVTAMQENANLRIQVEGHTCNIGTAEYNLALGDRRANAVRDYLTGRGIAASRLETVSYGEERPKHDNAREETRRLNRRAALVVRVQ